MFQTASHSEDQRWNAVEWLQFFRFDLFLLCLFSEMFLSDAWRCCQIWRECLHLIKAWWNSYSTTHACTHKVHTNTNWKSMTVILLCTKNVNLLSCGSYGKRGFSLFKVIPIHEHLGNPRHHYINASPSSWSPSKRFCMPARAVPPSSPSLSPGLIDWVKLLVTMRT